MSQDQIGTLPGSTTDGAALLAALRAFSASHEEGFLGSTRPSWIKKGGVWTRLNGDSSVSLCVFDGSTDREIALTTQAVPAGLLAPITGTTVPTGWVLANGQTLVRATYPALWSYASGSGNLAASEGAKTSGQYGPGDGSTTFSVPDLRGEFVRGLDLSAGIDAGRTVGSSQADEIKAHDHLIRYDTAAVQLEDPSYRLTGINKGTGASSGRSEDAGGAETRPRNIAYPYIIKT